MTIIYDTIEYNIENDNSIMQTLRNKLFKECSDIEEIFYTSIINYVNIFYIHLFYDELVSLCTKKINYLTLVNKLCYIDKTVLSLDFKKLSIKHKKEKQYLFEEKFVEIDIDCIKYYKIRDIVQYFSNFKEDFYVIFSWLYETFKDTLILDFMIYRHLLILKTEKTFNKIKVKFEIDLYLEHDLKKKIYDKEEIITSIKNDNEPPKQEIKKTVKKIVKKPVKKIEPPIKTKDKKPITIKKARGNVR